jgi:FemAB-related protein (PEP-CTERM system-associated)
VRFWSSNAFLYAERAGVVEGVLPLAQVKSLLFGNSLASLPFAVYGGVAASNSGSGRGAGREAQATAGRLGVDHLEMRNLAATSPGMADAGSLRHFRKAIAPEVEANMQAIPRKQRAMVRKGIKNGLRSEIDPDPGRFFALYADNVHRHGTPALPRRYFETAAGLRQRLRSLTVVDGSGRPLSSVLSFYFRDEVLPYYAGDALVGARTGGQRLQVLGVDASRLRAWGEGFRLRPQQAGNRLLCLQEELGLRAAAAVLRVLPVSS